MKLWRFLKNAYIPVPAMFSNKVETAIVVLTGIASGLYIFRPIAKDYAENLAREELEEYRENTI